MREIAKNESWERLKFESESGSFWDVDGFEMFDAGYDAATEENTAKIAQMQARFDELVNALHIAKSELEIQGCADLESNDVGFINYTTVIKAIAKVKDVK